MEKHITLPLTEELAKTLHAGDTVYLTGTIYTSRDAGHKARSYPSGNGRNSAPCLEVSHSHFKKDPPQKIKNNTITTDNKREIFFMFSPFSANQEVLAYATKKCVSTRGACISIKNVLWRLSGPFPNPIPLQDCFAVCRDHDTL